MKHLKVLLYNQVFVTLTVTLLCQLQEDMARLREYSIQVNRAKLNLLSPNDNDNEYDHKTSLKMLFCPCWH